MSNQKTVIKKNIIHKKVKILYHFKLEAQVNKNNKKNISKFQKCQNMVLKQLQHRKKFQIIKYYF